MYRGEKIGYSIDMIQHLRKIIGNEKEITVFYDIGCKFAATIQKESILVDHNLIKCVIPSMHCHGHGFRCLRLYHPTRNSGCGKIDGEGMERIWSFLGKFRQITREMGNQKRMEQLEDAVRHKCRLKLVGIVQNTKNKLLKIDKLIRESTVLFLQHGCNEIRAETMWRKERDSILTSNRRTILNTEDSSAYNIQIKLLDLDYFRHSIYKQSKTGIYI